MFHLLKVMNVLYRLFVINFLVLITCIFAAHLHDTHRINEHIKHSHHHVPTHNHDINNELLGNLEEDTHEHFSPADGKKYVHILKMKIDINKDGLIEPDELFKWILLVLKKSSLEESKDIFEEMDKNNDGMITWEEETMDSQKTFETDIEDGIDSDRKLFFLADKNGDGVLNSEEYDFFIHPEEYPEMLPMLIENVLLENDLNRDGVVDFDEFIAGAVDYVKDDEWLLTEKTKFKDYDRNGDGVLSDREILYWATSSNTRIAVEDTRYLFGALDDNHDSRLTFEEIMNNHDLFIDSVTNSLGYTLDELTERNRDEL